MYLEFKINIFSIFCQVTGLKFKLVRFWISWVFFGFLKTGFHSRDLDTQKCCHSALVKVILPDNQTRSKNISHCWTLCWFIPTAPVVHRSALYELVNSNTDEDNATFKEIIEEPAFPALINRQNATGSTLLHEACRNNSPEKAAILIRKGVEVERKVEGQERAAEGALVEK